jgi:hypothetical protein
MGHTIQANGFACALRHKGVCLTTMRYGPFFATLLLQFLLVLLCSAWCWQPVAPRAVWPEPAPAVEHLTEVCELSGMVEARHPFVHMRALNDHVAGRRDSEHGSLQTSPPFPLSATRLESGGESESEPSTRTSDYSIAGQALWFSSCFRARPPNRRSADDIAEHQIPVAVSAPDQTAGPRPPPPLDHNA